MLRPNGERIFSDIELITFSCFLFYLGSGSFWQLLFDLVLDLLSKFLDVPYAGNLLLGV
jgi:hypothetical protein